VVGLGTQDSLEEAKAFVDEHGLTIRMLWDGSSQSWAELGVSSQPSSMLLSPDGELVAMWLGPIPEDEALALAAGQDR
jgi:peroxiredoxin